MLYLQPGGFSVPTGSKATEEEYRRTFDDQCQHAMPRTPLRLGEDRDMNERCINCGRTRRRILELGQLMFPA
jgi:hypothetical protein